MLPIETSLVAATVYPDRARLTRQGQIELEAGSHVLEISGLPIQLDPDSLRAAGKGTGRARLQGVQGQRTFFSESPAETVRDLEAQVEAAQDKLFGLEAQQELVKQQRAAVKAVVENTDKFALALAAGEMDLPSQLAMMDGLRQRAAALDGELLVLGGEKRLQDRELQKLQNQMNQLRGARPRQAYSALVEIEALEACTLTLELRYTVNGAGWRPLYDLRLLEEGDAPQLEVGYLAQVTQQTGENWEQVRLTLSTARPALAGVLPELEPVYIRPAPPLMKAAPYRNLDMAAVAPAAIADTARFAKASESAFGLAAAPLEEERAEVEMSGMTITYQVPGVATVPPDGQPHRVTVARYPLNPRLDYVAAPRLVDAVYRRARVVNDSPYTLLPGQANLFAGGEFIGATSLELTAPQGEIELFLGADDRIKVKRELKRRDVDKTLIGGKRRVHYAYEIELENLLPDPAQVTLHDQYPVSQHEEIKCRLDSVNPRPDRQTELNLLDWELPLVAKEKRVVRLDYTVEYPANMDVIGLD